MLRRPNGRPQACEPCRKRKVACDNHQPICRRCQKAARSVHCEYIVDSRMSIRTPLSPGQPISALPTSASSASSPGHQIQEPRISDVGNIGATVDSLPRYPFIETGYLGPTSFCDIYEQAQENLSIPRGRSSGNSSTAGQVDTASSLKLPKLSPQTLERCVAVLRKVPRREEGERLCNSYSNPNEIWLGLVGHRVRDSFYDTFGQYLGDDRTDSGLGQIAKRLCYNTSRTLLEDDKDPEQWVHQFSGPNLRWETMGIIFFYWANCTYLSTPLYAELLRNPQHKSDVTDYLEAMDFCIEISKSLTNGNSLLVFLLLRRGLLESMKSGDTSPLMWKLHSDTVSLLTFLGLHACAPDGPKYTPTICSEWKRRVCAFVFIVDKLLASFTGRPPALSRRYMLTPLPLDLDNDVLLGYKASLSQAMQQLNAAGWNKNGVMTSSTIYRARTAIAFLKDELLEIAMGHGLERTVETLLDILRRESDMMAALPASLQYKHGDMLDPCLGPTIVYSRLLVHLEHLHNLFFTHRLLIQRGYDSQADLVAVSFEMLSVTLLSWTHLDRLSRIAIDMEWLVMAYGAPSGGILCQELLKQTAAPSMVPTSGKPGPTRFAIIEKLFLLIGFLDWVSPNAPNSDLCRSCKRVIRLVLEKVTQETPPAGGSPQAVPVFEPWKWDLGDASLDFEFDLLDTFEWLRPELPSMQGQVD